MSDQYTLDDVTDEISENPDTVSWSETPLGEVANIVNGSAFSSDEYTDDGIPLIRISNIGPGTTSDENLKYLPSEFLNQVDKKFILEKDDILMAMSGATTGKVSRLPSRHAPALLNQRIARFETSNELNHHFLLFCLQSHDFQRYVDAFASGGAQDNISAYDLEKISIPFPPLEEQRKIATVLYNVDQAIQETEEIVDQTKRVQRGIEQRLFREGYFDHQNIDEKRLVTIPKNWDFDQLSKHTINSAFGPRFGSERYDDEGNISTLRTTDLNDRGHISLETMPMADLEFDEIEDHLLEPGDFMITRSGTTGISTVWEGYDKPTIPGAFLIRFRFEDTLNPNFMKYYVNSSIGRSRVNRRAKGGVQKNLAGSDLLNMRFPIPDKEEQQKIVEVLDGFEERIQHERKYKNKLKRLKQGLMQDLLSGTVRTTNTNIEVSEEIAQHG